MAMIITLRQAYGRSCSSVDSSAFVEVGETNEKRTFWTQTFIK